jgi:hypothetical protein
MPDRSSDAVPGPFPPGGPGTGDITANPIAGRRSAPGDPSHGRSPVRPLRELLWGTGIALVGGSLVAAGWAWSIPLTRRWSGDDEVVVAQDGTLGLIGFGAGVLTGLLVIMFPSRTPAVRAGVGIIAAVIGAGLAVVLGDLLGAPGLLAYGMVLVWPIATSVIVLARSVIGMLFQQE